MYNVKKNALFHETYLGAALVLYYISQLILSRVKNETCEKYLNFGSHQEFVGSSARIAKYSYVRSISSVDSLSDGGTVENAKSFITAPPKLSTSTMAFATSLHSSNESNDATESST